MDPQTDCEHFLERGGHRLSSLLPASMFVRVNRCGVENELWNMREDGNIIVEPGDGTCPRGTSVGRSQIRFDVFRVVVFQGGVRVPVCQLSDCCASR